MKRVIALVALLISLTSHLVASEIVPGCKPHSPHVNAIDTKVKLLPGTKVDNYVLKLKLGLPSHHDPELISLTLRALDPKFKEPGPHCMYTPGANGGSAVWNREADVETCSWIYTSEIPWAKAKKFCGLSPSEQSDDEILFYPGELSVKYKIPLDIKLGIYRTVQTGLKFNVSIGLQGFRQY